MAGGRPDRAQLAFTAGGETARRLARYRSPIPLPEVTHTDEMVRQVEAALLTIARLEKGDKVVIVAGSPPGSPGKTNALRVHRIGDAVALP